MRYPALSGADQPLLTPTSPTMRPADNVSYDKAALPALTSGNDLLQYLGFRLMTARSKVTDPGVDAELAALCMLVVELDSELQDVATQLFEPQAVEVLHALMALVLDRIRRRTSWAVT